jgi:hypothetical protein
VVEPKPLNDGGRGGLMLLAAAAAVGTADEEELAAAAAADERVGMRWGGERARTTLSVQGVLMVSQGRAREK